jgi:hypothetical protein
LKLNGIHHFPVYVVDVSMSGGSENTLKKTQEHLVVGSKDSGLEINKDISTCMVMCRDQNAGRCRYIKIDIGSFERLKDLKYLGTNLTNQNSIQA